MSDIMPEGESMRRAIRFVSDRMQEDAEQALGPVLNDAAIRFDLDPMQTEFLTNFFAKRRADKGT